jgi:hypothetical protein
VRPDRSLDLVSLARSKHWAISERVPQEITPAARRVLDRLTEVPTCLCDAAGNVLAGNRRWLAFNCGAATADGRDRDMPWRTFTSAPSTVSAPPGMRPGSAPPLWQSCAPRPAATQPTQSYATMSDANGC